MDNTHMAGLRKDMELCHLPIKNRLLRKTSSIDQSSQLLKVITICQPLFTLEFKGTDWHRARTLMIGDNNNRGHRILPTSISSITL